jgi:hypothetical protein
MIEQRLTMDCHSMVYKKNQSDLAAKEFDLQTQRTVDTVVRRQVEPRDQLD